MIFPLMNSEEKEKKEKRFRAWQIINEVSIACLVIAVVYIAMGLFEGKLLIAEGIITGILGLILSKEISRAAALLLVAISLISLSNGMVSWVGMIELGERNILLGFIGLWCGFRALKATFVLRGSPTIDDMINRFATARK